MVNTLAAMGNLMAVADPDIGRVSRVVYFRVASQRASAGLPTCWRISVTSVAVRDIYMKYVAVRDIFLTDVETPLKEITMPQGHVSTTNRPRLDDLLAMMGITREQLREMTAEELFAAATRWQNVATAAEAHRRPSRLDGLIHGLPVPSTSSATLN
jgi:hypothetical protein